MAIYRGVGTAIQVVNMVREFFNFLVYFSQHTLLTFAVCLSFWLLFARLPVFNSLSGKLSKTGGGRWLALASFGFLALYLLISTWYLTLSGFAGEVEPMVSSLSWMVRDGLPLYHGLHDPARYSVLYGPSVFLTNGLFLQILGPSLFATKLASALAGLASLLLLYAAVARQQKDQLALILTGLAVLYYWCQGFAVYLVRPDSLLVFSVSFGLYAAVKARRLFALLAVGMILGFAVNLKIHAGFYFLPVLAILRDRFGWRFLLQVGLLAGAVVLAPFVFYSQISLANYIVWLKNAMGHGLGWTTIFETTRYAAALLLPMAGLLLLNEAPKRWLAANIWLISSMVTAVLVILVLSAKPGAGLVHLLPLVPTSLYIVSLLLRALPKESWQRSWRSSWRPCFGLGAVVAMGLTLTFSGTVHEYRNWKLVQWENLDTRALIRDIDDIQAAFSGLTLGMAVGGENACFRSTWLRPLLVFNHNPLLLDPIAVMDCHLAGKNLPRETYEALARGEVSVWLVPKAQEPFAKANWYPPHEPIFSHDFMDYFRANYTRRSQSRFFDLWIWNGLSGDALGEPALAALRKLGDSG